MDLLTALLIKVLFQTTYFIEKEGMGKMYLQIICLNMLIFLTINSKFFYLIPPESDLSFYFLLINEFHHEPLRVDPGMLDSLMVCH